MSMSKPRIQLIKEHARQVLAESIQFRTTVISDIHAEIYAQVWQTQDDSNAQRILSPRIVTVHRLSFD